MKKIVANNYEVWGHSEKKSGKSQNGDTFDFWVTADHKWLCCLVADGVGSHPCDWKASNTACESMKQKLYHIEGNIINLLTESIQFSHEKVKNETGKCSGMLSTMAFLVWKINGPEIIYCSIGDSRIYLIKEASTSQISTDDTDYFYPRVENRLKTEAGAVTFKKGLTQAIGQNSDLNISIFTKKFESTDVFVLMTDGAHGDAPLPYDFHESVYAANLKQQIQHYISSCSQSNEDDATMIILRRLDLNNDLIKKASELIGKNLPYYEENIKEIIMAQILLKNITNKIQKENYDDIIRDLIYAENFNIRFNQQVMIKLYDQISGIENFEQMKAKFIEIIRMSF